MWIRGDYIVITVVPQRCDASGIEVFNVSLVRKGTLLTIYGEIYSTEDSDKPEHEVDVLVTFHKSDSSIIFAVSSRHFIPFMLNHYTLFVAEAELPPDAVSLISEIRLQPYLHTREER